MARSQPWRDHRVPHSRRGQAAGRLARHRQQQRQQDRVATQIDGLGHATEGDDDHWYNGFTEKQWGGNWGPRKADAATIPPIVARGVLIDVAGSKDLDALPSNYQITVADLEQALQKQKTQLKPGDVVLIRTGTL